MQLENCPQLTFHAKKKLFFAAEEPELRAPGLLQADLAGPADPEGAPGGGAQERQDQHGRGERNKDKKNLFRERAGVGSMLVTRTTKQRKGIYGVGE